MELKNFFPRDSQGNVLPLATCYLYLRGTETLVTGLQQANGDPLSNPWASDANGLVQFKAQNGAYDFRVTTGSLDYRMAIQCSGITEITAHDFGAMADGVTDDSNALELFWQYVKSRVVNYNESLLDFAYEKFKLAPGIYRVTRSINWTGLMAWNVHIEAEGAIIVGAVDGKSIIDLCNCRGVHVNGLAIQSEPGKYPKSAILIGPAETNTSGNNRFSNVKTAGTYSIAACHNIGCETTLYDDCYWQNTMDTGYAYAADGSNLLGAVSDYVTLRQPGEAVSFTSNNFQACRFANYASHGNATYTESTSGWHFDKTCYFLSFDNASMVIRSTGNTRTISLKLAGLFETTQTPGLKYVVKIIADDNAYSAIDGFELDAASAHASQALIRLETPVGVELTGGEFSLRSAIVKLDTTWTGTVKVFSGSRMSFAGELFVRPSAAIDLSKLVKMHGIIHTSDASLITKDAENKPHSYIVIDDVQLSGQGMAIGGVNGGFVGFQGGVVPRIRSIAPNADADLWLSGKGNGKVRFGDFTAGSDTPTIGTIQIKTNSGQLITIPVTSITG